MREDGMRLKAAPSLNRPILRVPWTPMRHRSNGHFLHFVPEQSRDFSSSAARRRHASEFAEPVAARPQAATG